ncbi:arf-GAP with SH3 domain, ANK repeat and PH domain-containing protein 1 isoform X2 [Salvelinus fontinalis]|uniref:arf-GAP with SH3 domain, ANK repeat and PH domain-containing protein 1 isoform X2 n=1 Tax=Salvelinus fontinalis TaxID=8038 RepID=UPI0024861AC1|nr:arf-GAP with SH3 domain, ANK repeat and PH domain-containing protein 1 isoform X2 [Salvelinus fontinalis]
MPEFISVDGFIAETLEDYSSPTTSSFTTKMSSCRNAVDNIEEALDCDRTVLQKMKKAAKAKYASGQDHISHLELYISSMEKLVVNFRSNGEKEVASAFTKFAEFSKELLTPIKNLLKSMLHNINFFLDSLVKGDLKEVKGDLKKPFDKAWRDYENKFTKIEKEKRELAKQYGMVRTEVSGGEIAEELEKERRMFQLQMCEYLIKVNEIKTKKGVDLLQNLIKHYHSQCNFFQECLVATEKLKQYIDELTGALGTIKHRQDEEKRQLCSLRDQLRPSLQPELKEDSLSKQTFYSMHQLQGNKHYGTEKAGYLYKRSDGLRKMWQKRNCTVQNCYLTIAHGTPNKPPAKLNLLTCQVKPSLEDKKCFDLISHNRTYHFLADDEPVCVAWISVLTNSKQKALNVALDERKSSGDNSVEDLTRAITEDIRRMPGNNMCCDCGAPDPTWISTNLGILTCIECSGIHREMGVHYSRIKSLSLDKLGTSELMLAKNMGNSGFNEIVEANVLSPSLKPTAESDMMVRKDFILCKYMECQFAQHSSSSFSTLRRNLQEAVCSRDIFSLLQLYAVRLDLSQPLANPVQENGETALHLAILLADRTSLHIVDFLVHNCNNLDVQTARGNSALHYCCLHNRTECLKLLLRAKANIHNKNAVGETGLDIASRLKNTHCEELINQSQSNQFNMHVEYEWQLRQDDLYESDDDLDDKTGPVQKGRSSRPFNLYQTHTSSSTLDRGGGGLFSVGRRLALAHNQKREVYASPCPHTRSLDSPPPAPLFSPAPSLPSRVKAPNVPPPPPPVSPPVGWGGIIIPTTSSSSSSKKRTPPPPLDIRHKRTYSEPTPQVPHSPHSSRQSHADYGVPSNSTGYSGPESSFQKCVSGSPKYSVTALNSLSEVPERGFRADGESKKSHFVYQMPQPSRRHPPLNSTMAPCSISLQSNGAFSHQGDPPHPMPRRALPKPKMMRVQAIYGCVGDHHDELTFNEGEVLVVLGEDDADWWHGYVEGQPNKKGLFPSSFVQLLSD